MSYLHLGISFSLRQICTKCCILFIYLFFFLTMMFHLNMMLLHSFLSKNNCLLVSNLTLVLTDIAFFLDADLLLSARSTADISTLGKFQTIDLIANPFHIEMAMTNHFGYIPVIELPLGFDDQPFSQLLF